MTEKLIYSNHLIQWQQKSLDSMTAKVTWLNDSKITSFNDSKTHLIQWRQNKLDTMTAKLTWINDVQNSLDPVES